MKKILIFSLVFLAASLSYAADTQERVISFNSALQVNKNASVDVSEQITVNAQGQKIRRGIVRVLPSDSKKLVIVTSLEMDGKPHPYFIEHSGGNIEINFGNDNFLTHGIHTYKLSYTMGNVVGFFDDYDEVYWNVTGSDWDFVIDNASIKITLPEGANAIQGKISTYTGREGSKTTMAATTGPLEFETTRPLMPGEGFTVAVPWQKGVVVKPAKAAVEKPKYDTVYTKAAYILLFLALVIYSFIKWKKICKNPYETVVAEYAPPKDVSPAFMRTVIRKNPDQKAFCAAMISLAMKGKITITQNKMDFLQSTDTFLNKVDDNTDNMFPEERGIMEMINSSPFKISEANYGLISKAMSAVEKYLKEGLKPYVTKNAKPIIVHASIILCMLLPIFFLNPIFFAATVIGLALWSYLYLFVNKLLGCILIIFFGPLWLMLISGIAYMATMLGFVPPVITVLSIICFIIYGSVIMNIYTEPGRVLVNQINGFKLYMSTAEEGRVAVSDPTDAERIFADYLPYAFALDMENQWFKKFEGIVSAAAIEQTVAKAGGRDFVRSAALIHAINSAAPVQRSSGGGGHSGSGGGGFSGGGSGGGGGHGR
ncbi:MAG: DUF2207 domain-containing protein [Elusimicrobia bacterium]|nr:DUF2207 domain-containing protein [Elusimicrobiota bacterium]